MEKSTNNTQQAEENTDVVDNENNIAKIVEKLQEKQMDKFSEKIQESFSQLIAVIGRATETEDKTSGKRKQGKGINLNQGSSSKKARTNVKSQKEDRPTCSKNVSRYTDASDSDSDDSTSVTRAYAESDNEVSNDENSENDDVLSIPDQSQIRDLIDNEREDEGTKKSKLNGNMLNSIKQKFALKEDMGRPLESKTLAEILEKFFMEKSDEEKMKSLLKEYNKPQNCDKVNVPYCNEDIWRINLSSLHRHNDWSIQKILLHVIKASYAMFYACDKLVAKEENETCNEVLNLLIDAVALLGHSSIEINNLRRDLMKHRLPAHLRKLVKNVPPDSKFLFGDDIQKRISQIAATNTALQHQGRHHNQQNNSRYNNHNNHRQHQQSYSNNRSNYNGSKNFNAPQRSSAQGKKGNYKQSSYKNRRN